jgi:hypothetical protein
MNHGERAEEGEEEGRWPLYSAKMCGGGRKRFQGTVVVECGAKSYVGSAEAWTRSGGVVVVVLSFVVLASTLDDTRGDDAGDVDADDTDDATEGDDEALDALRDEPEDELRRIVVVIGIGVVSGVMRWA